LWLATPTVLALAGSAFVEILSHGYFRESSGFDRLTTRPPGALE